MDRTDDAQRVHRMHVSGGERREAERECDAKIKIGQQQAAAAASGRQVDEYEYDERIFREVG